MSISDAMRSKLANYGVWTYRSAWALEVVAALIGLSTGLFLGVQAFRSSGAAEPTDLVLASAPFFMVALAELTKIPIATLLFSVRWIWKPILLLLLLLLALITFETVLMGLERATTLRQLKYQELVKEKERLELRLKNLSGTLQNIEQDNTVQQAQQNIERVNRLAEEERKTVLSQISQVDAELEGQVVLSPEAASVRERIKDTEERRNNIQQERNAEIETAYSRFQSQRDSYTARLTSTSASDVQKAKWADELSRLANPVPPLQAKYAAQLDVIDKELDGLRRSFDEARSKTADKSGSQRSQLEVRRTELMNELDSTSKKWTVERDTARNALRVAQDRQSSRANTVPAFRQEQQSLSDKITELEGQRIVLARQDQVQRIGSRIYSKKPEEVTEGEANFIAVIWFGSLAALAALAGPVTAIVALGLQRIGLAEEPNRKGGTLRVLLRKMLLSWRWRRTRTKIVKEEVPIETIVKEILYVPILTDDPDVVRRTIASGLPPEIADMVKITTAGKAKASEGTS